MKPPAAFVYVYLCAKLCVHVVICDVCVVIWFRYGDGVYFTDESCKSHQYTRKKKARDGTELHCLLYCRVATGKMLEYVRLHVQLHVPPDPQNGRCIVLACCHAV